MMSPRIKCVSNYQNSRMALIEALRHGYDFPILLNDRGKVAEGPASCLFIVRDGVAITPGITSGILESVTRRTILKMCREELAIPVEERDVVHLFRRRADVTPWEGPSRIVAVWGPTGSPGRSTLAADTLDASVLTTT